MAMNRKMTMAEKEVRDYAQRQMERAEQLENILFTEEHKEQILEYAAMTGDDYNIRKIVRDLADAVRSSDEEKVDEILGDAKEEIDGFPDRSVGMAELKGYGYTADDMFPLRQEMALELHRVGEKVYCLQSDGSHGDYASREMILEHEGLYGVEKEAWQRMQEQEDEIDFEEAGLYQPPMTDLDRNEALRMFDAGETVYLITTYPRPIAVRERMEIERGPEHYQMEREDVERIRTLEKRMQEYPQIKSLKEAKLLLGTENRYGIYQIVEGSPGREYEFMDLNFIERHGTVDTKTAMEMLSESWKQIERMDHFVETMRKMSSLEQRLLLSCPITAEEMKADIMAELVVLEAEKEKQVILKLKEATDIFLGDKEVILEVIENLLSNALRYAKEQITVNICVTYEELKICVEDDGSGFDSDMETVTKAFYQQNVKDSLNHAGMGMYISRLYCEKHGGRLVLENRTTGGAAVTAIFRRIV